jgi:hypothetical protein
MEAAARMMRRRVVVMGMGLPQGALRPGEGAAQHRQVSMMLVDKA